MIDKVKKLKQTDPSFFSLSLIKIVLVLFHFIVLFIPLYQIIYTGDTIERLNLTDFAAFQAYIIVWVIVFGLLIYFSLVNNQKVAKWFSLACAVFATFVLFMTLFYFFTDRQEAASFIGVDVQLSIGFVLQVFFYLSILASLFIKKEITLVLPSLKASTKKRSKQKKKLKHK